MRKIKSDLQLDDEIDLHEKGWVIQRVGWGVLVAILVAASLGLFGNGVLSKTTASQNGVAVEYERFCRFEAETELNLNATAANGDVVLKIPQSYLREMQIEKVVPVPEKQEFKGADVVFTYRCEQLAQISVYVYPKTRGRVSTTIDVNGTKLLISHFIYP